jgi:hypothetical protein
MKGMAARGRSGVVVPFVWLLVALPACGSSEGGDGGDKNGGAENGGSTSGGGTGNGGTSGGGTGTGGTSGGSGFATIDAFCDAYFPALGATYERCFETGADWTRLLDPELVCPRMIESEAAGRLVYTPSDGTACIAALTSDDCPLTDELIPTAACGNAVVGTVALGGDCASYGLFDLNECAGSAYCGGGDSSACLQTCVAFREENEACELTVRCAPGLTCLNDVCVPNVDAGEGEPCDGPDAPECATNFYCDGASTTEAGACQPTRTSGACASSDECSAGYLCNSSGTCTRRKELGDSCVEGENECLLFDFCAAGSCTDEYASEGEPCVPASGELVPCEYGQRCDQALGECVPEKALGEECATRSECAGPNVICDETTLTCAACDLS